VHPQDTYAATDSALAVNLLVHKAPPPPDHLLRRVTTCPSPIQCPHHMPSLTTRTQPLRRPVLLTPYPPPPHLCCVRSCVSVPAGCIQVDEVQQANLRLCPGETYSFRWGGGGV